MKSKLAKPLDRETSSLSHSELAIVTCLFNIPSLPTYHPYCNEKSKARRVRRLLSPYRYCAGMPEQMAPRSIEKEWESGCMGEEMGLLQMDRVGVGWHRLRGTSAVSSGTRSACCDWPVRSQEITARHESSISKCGITAHADGE